MGNRRFAQISTSDEDNAGEDAPTRKRGAKSSSPSPENKQSPKKKRRMKKVGEDDEEDYQVEEEELSEEVSEEEEDEEEEAEEEVEEEETKRKRISKKKKKDDDDEEEEASQGDAEEEEDEDEEEEAVVPVDAKPVGEAIKITGKGKNRKTHFEAFEYDGNQYDLEDPVLITPESDDSSNSKMQKPYVAIIKDVTQDKDGDVMMTGQWFYRPEEADKKGGGNWQSNDTRELFYSFHRDDVPAESVMHKCVVHFVPLHKQLPNRKQYPGFIVRKVYDTVERKLWKLTDKDYEDKKQHEIDLLVQKTMRRLVDLPDIEPEENNVTDQEELLKSKRGFRKKNITPLEISRDEDLTKPDQTPRAETPGSCLSNASEYYCILVKLQALTGDTHRDKWLERLLPVVQYVCTNNDETVKDETNGGNHESENKSPESSKSPKDGQSLVWPDAAVQAVTALEKASHESFASDFQKYNQKLRQLLFNLKNNALLARRLLNGELEASKILSMSPIELKEGLTAEETAKKEPDDSERMQMTDARCARCSEFKVGVRDIIQAGHNERYQLECIACGHSWYASRDEAASLTVDAPSSAKTVGSAPLATAKFESIEKRLANAGEADDLLKKTIEPFVPVLDAPKPVAKTNKDENTEEAPKTAAVNPE